VTETPDGNHITLLFIAALNWLCPELLLNGHVYRVYGALFKVTFPDGTYQLFQDDKSFDAWKEDNPNKKYKVSRAKGLGELTKEEAYEQLMQVSTRNIKQLEITDYDDFVNALEIAMGDDATRRSEILDSYYEDVAKKGVDIAL
jgi:DNA gyrase subunit B